MRKATQNVQFFYNNVLLDVVDDFMYLGVKFNYNNSFRKQELYAAEQGSKALHSVLCKSRALNLELDVQVELFDKCILPVLSYGCEVWGCSSTAIVSRIQLKYYKYIFKLRKTTPTCMVLGETGRLPIEDIIKMRILNFWFKIVTSSNQHKITVIMYKLMYKLDLLDADHGGFK